MKTLSETGVLQKTSPFTFPVPRGLGRMDPLCSRMDRSPLPKCLLRLAPPETGGGRAS